MNELFGNLGDLSGMPPLMGGPEPDFGKIKDELLDKRKDFEGRMGNFLKETNEYANSYRMIAQKLNADRGAPTGLANTVVSQTTRAVETLCTMQYAMMTSNAPNFDCQPINPNTDPFHLAAITSLLEFQKERIEFNRKLLKGLRSLNLFGTVFYETPWTSWPGGNGAPAWEATDFLPLSINQVGFAPNTFDLNTADWRYILNMVSPTKLREWASMDDMQLTWRRGAIEAAIADASDTERIPPEIKQRLSDAGYVNGLNKVMDFMLYYGPLDCMGQDRQTYVVGMINNRHIIRFHPLKNEFNSGIIPFLSAQFIEFELEPYGYGIGKLTKRIQSDINANRNRVTNLILFSLFNMWKMSKFSGIKPQNLKIRPWHVIETEDMAGIEPIRPNMEAIQYGLKLDEMLAAEFETVTGATKNLQAMTTDATATEARITQNEAVRRIAVQSEIIADRLIRNYLYISHKNNLQYLNSDIWMRVSGEEKPSRISPIDIMHEVEFKLRLTTDKDFRPKRTQDMITALQIVTSLRNFVPPNFDATALIQEIVRGFGIDPRLVFKQMNPAVQNSMEAAQQLARLQSLSGSLNKEQGVIQNGNESTQQFMEPGRPPLS